MRIFYHLICPRWINSCPSFDTALLPLCPWSGAAWPGPGPGLAADRGCQAPQGVPSLYFYTPFAIFPKITFFLVSRKWCSSSPPSIMLRISYLCCAWVAVIIVPPLVNFP